jgi:phosphoribosylformylglycinamidine synthase
LAECCFADGRLGADVTVGEVHVCSDQHLNTAAALFGESASRVVISAAPSAVPSIVDMARAAGVPVSEIGRVGGPALTIKMNDRVVVSLSVERAERQWSSAIDQYFARHVA